MLTLLRNLEEHWEDPQGPSATKLCRKISDITPGRIAYTKNDIWLEGVPVGEIRRSVENVGRGIRGLAGTDD